MASPCGSIYIRIIITTLFGIWTPSKLSETTFHQNLVKDNKVFLERRMHHQSTPIN